MIDIQKYSLVSIKQKDLLPDDHGWLVLYDDHMKLVDSISNKLTEREKEIEVLKKLVSGFW